LKIIAFSSICIDYFPEKKLSVPGGNSLNFAVQTRRLGEKDVAIAGFIGTDPASKQILKLCVDEGINARYINQIEGATASNKLYITAEGERYSKPGEWQNGVKDDGLFTNEVWNFILDQDVIALPCNDRHLDDLLKERTENNFISVDFMHFDSADFISRYLPLLDIAFVSPEHRSLNSLKTLSCSLNKPVVAMLGAEGSIAFYDGKEYKQNALKTEKVVDTTGCGDAYQAAFCYAINHNSTVNEAMQLATVTATKVLTGYGGVW